MDREKLNALLQGDAEDPWEQDLLDAEEELEDDEPKAIAPPASKLRRALRFLRRYRVEIAVWARYVLPVCSLVVLFVMGWFYNVRSVSVGVRYNVSLWRLYGNTLTGTHTYLGGNTVAARTWFYGALSIGAIVGILFFLLGGFLAVLALYTAWRSFRAGEDDALANRMKTVFKIAFPNRLCLFLSNALLLVPAAYPHFVSFVGSRFLVVSGQKMIYVLSNSVLITQSVLLAVTLVISLVIPRYERSKKMNMFFIDRSREGQASEEDDA